MLFDGGLCRVKQSSWLCLNYIEIQEGLNSVIQATKAKARGYRTFKNYKIIVYLLTGKLDFSRVNARFKDI